VYHGGLTNEFSQLICIWEKTLVGIPLKCCEIYKRSPT
jgi:hypothetical protein